MQKFITGLFILLPFFISAQSDSAARYDDSLKRAALFLEPVEVRAIRASENSPFAKTTITGKEIKKTNLGQDLPFMLNQTPSVVINADTISYYGEVFRLMQSAKKAGAKVVANVR